MYNPHTCSVPTFYNINTDYAQYQCLGQSLNTRTAAGNFLFKEVSRTNPVENQSQKTENKNELLTQCEFAFGMDFAKNSNLTPQSQPQITPRLYQTQFLNNVNKPMHTMPWGEEALAF